MFDNLMILSILGNSICLAMYNYKDDMNLTPFEEGNDVKIIADTIYLVSGDIGEKIAYSYCILQIVYILKLLDRVSSKKSFKTFWIK